MSDSTDRTTEQRIFKSAVNAFLSKGYDGTKMKEIAEAAGINKALLHYYFRTKEELFKKVLSQLISEFSEMLSNSLSENKNTASVLSSINQDYEKFYHNKKDLPLFVLNTFHQYPSLVKDVLEKSNMRHLAKTLVGQKISEYNLKEKEVMVWFISFLSLKIMPLIGRKLFQFLLQITEEEYEILRKEQSKFAVEILEK